MPQRTRNKPSSKTGSNGYSLYGGMDLIMANQMQGLVNNVVTSRSAMLQKFLDPDPRRNIDDECGYPTTSEISAETYRAFYDREPIATRVVEVLPKETWSTQPSIFEDEDAEAVTEFEEAWQDVSKQLRGGSWYQDEEGNPVWEHLLRVDVLSGIGSYGVLLLGIDDGKELKEPIDGLRTPDSGASRSKEYKLIYLRSFDESLVQITRYEQDKSNPRFGMPIEYLVTFNDPNEPSKGGLGIQLASQAVHWTRLLHIADDLGSSEILGVPRMRPVFNRLCDLRKLYGGSAEMYWKGAFPGFSLETNPALGGDVEVDVEDLQDQMEQYMNGLQRFMIMMGMSAKPLSPQVVDPTAQINVQIEAICIRLGIPVRIFKGSERGELASSQDKGTWNGRLSERQRNYVTPRIIVPFVDRIISIGVLPPPEGYSVIWPDLGALSELEEADIAVKKTEAMAKYVGGSVESLMPPMDYLTRILNYTQDEGKAILEAAEEIIEEKQAEADKLQKEQSAQQEKLAKEQAKAQPQQIPSEALSRPGQQSVQIPSGALLRSGQPKPPTAGVSGAALSRPAVGAKPVQPEEPLATNESIVSLQRGLWPFVDVVGTERSAANVARDVSVKTMVGNASIVIEKNSLNTHIVPITAMEPILSKVPLTTEPTVKIAPGVGSILSVTSQARNHETHDIDSPQTLVGNIPVVLEKESLNTRIVPIAAMELVLGTPPLAKDTIINVSPGISSMLRVTDTEDKTVHYESDPWMVAQTMVGNAPISSQEPLLQTDASKTIGSNKTPSAIKLLEVGQSPFSLERMARVINYKPSQKRDKEGQWTKGGSGGAAGGKTSVEDARKQYESAYATFLKNPTSKNSKASNEAFKNLKLAEKGKSPTQSAPTKPQVVVPTKKASAKEVSKQMPVEKKQEVVAKPVSTPQAAASPEPVVPGKKLTQKQWEGSLGENEAKAIDYYIGDKGYTKIRNCQNKKVGCGPDVQNSISHLNSAMNRAPKYKEPTYRGLAFKSEKERAAFVTRIQKNGLVDKGFTSSSKKFTTADNFSGTSPKEAKSGIILKVNGKSGMDISKFNRNEQEVLMPPSVGFKFVSMEKMDSGKLLVHVREE